MSRVQKNEKENDQAGELRSRIERQKAKSSLPKRSKVHQNKKKKSKVKIKLPMIQLLALFFILLPIGFYSLYTYFQDRPLPVTKSDQVVLKEEDIESIPTTATAEDLKEKESAKAEAEKEKEEAEAKAKAQQEAEAKAKAQQEAEEKVKAQREAEAKAKAQQEAAEKAKAQREAEEKAKKAAAEKKNAQAAKPDKEGYKVVLHTVQGEETLFRISMNYYKSQEGIALIREWNGLNGNEISKGQVLKIPIKK
ncbi:LysM peptidoglycan-binding domain-containing protein [Peribacillus castrilensis]|uniref:Peptidoglycan-binding protein n=1 Tax=Peribacillus simplex TaxID=1478 RepID=A0AAN2PJY8_9BACI|nr:MULTISPECIES: LysM peptidoglycan-binding domain-containing protein [Peribacillus]MCP1153885.1 LysM peptidoglycan-binding domain-containing protein [Peribacillus frigoritolerans]MCT1387123.1 LysM peptidoglycan-binding domain-containing protein [Peribacillus frigoritolerans]CEG33509.1 peptidoglycan-binding protein [Peribacillus simplex]